MGMRLREDSCEKDALGRMMLSKLPFEWSGSAGSFLKDVGL